MDCTNVQTKESGIANAQRPDLELLALDASAGQWAEKSCSASNRGRPVKRAYKRRKTTTKNINECKPKRGYTNSLFAEKARACTECGKQFSSWKALFGHMRCHPERQWRGIQPPLGVLQQREARNSVVYASQTCSTSRIINEEVQMQENALDVTPRLNNFAEVKQRRTKKNKRADCFNSDSESIEAAYIKEKKQIVIRVEQEEGSSDDTDRKVEMDLREQHDMARCLVMLSAGVRTLDDYDRETAFSDNRDGDEDEELGESTGSEGGIKCKWDWEEGTKIVGEGFGFECGTCKKVFRSHQALGGHRASHKKVKGCFARTLTLLHHPSEHDGLTFSHPHHLHYQPSLTLGTHNHHYHDQNNSHIVSKKINKLSNLGESTCNNNHSPKLPHHQCSICSRVFATGQALGGHKRCHWGAPVDPRFDMSPSSSAAGLLSLGMAVGPMVLGGPASKVLDLNMPAPMDEIEECCADVELRMFSSSSTIHEIKKGGESLALSSSSSLYGPQSQSSSLSQSQSHSLSQQHNSPYLYQHATASTSSLEVHGHESTFHIQSGLGIGVGRNNEVNVPFHRGHL